MFDARTSELLKSAPGLPDLDPSVIPRLLTRHYADLVSARLRGEEPARRKGERWSLELMADAYEMIASLEEDSALRRAAAFVAGTAQQILTKRDGAPEPDQPKQLLERDCVDASVAAGLLFLAAEQYADANEASSAIPASAGPFEIRILGDHIRDLTRGRLTSILLRAERWRLKETLPGPIQTRALRALASLLCEGIELLAAKIMSVPVPAATPARFDTAQSAFRRVIELCTNSEANIETFLDRPFHTHYAGPHHLASLLISAADAIEGAALTRVAPPDGANREFWAEWLSFRAEDKPFVWKNHREAIAQGFHQTGQSAVLVLPTGAGKTTVSALKIAGCLACGKQVIFLAPTHALSEQLTEDLQEIFPSDRFPLNVSVDIDSILLEGNQLQDIEVMTPERCLAMLSFSPRSFAKVGLLVFDECHLLAPQPGKIRRALDGMLCLLAFTATVPEADLLFLSAMVKNGPEFAAWVSSLTNRPCVAIDLLWKPSRQARGVLVYSEAELAASTEQARRVQRKVDREKGKRAKSVRAAAERELLALPLVIWGLEHNWTTSPRSLALTKISAEKFNLAGAYKGGEIWATPNANASAAKVAIDAAESSLKTIVFVNTKADAVSTARRIACELNTPINLSDAEKEVWDALEAELGSSKHSVFSDLRFGAVAHNASMLRLERTLSERLFRRADGAKVIVATPTLAQGLNLPAHLAILAGDKRAGEAKGEREDLQAHEVLNAAARAGRAGHLANGVVLLIPEPIMKYKHGEAPKASLAAKLTSILPEDDRCVAITDPLEIVLDRLMEAKVDDRDVRYTVNRLATLADPEDGSAPTDTVISRSFGGFLARQRAEEAIFLKKVELVSRAARDAADQNPDRAVILLASQSGVSLDLLERLRVRLQASAGKLPTSIATWVDWTLEWMAEDNASRDQLLSDVSKSALVAAGCPTTAALKGSTLKTIADGIKGWIEGKTIKDIEIALGGDPSGVSATSQMCPRARELVSTFIPRGLSFVLGVVSRMVEELDLLAVQDDLEEHLIQSLSAAVRRGFSEVKMLDFANKRRDIRSRVQLHEAYAIEQVNLGFDWDEDE